MDIKQDILVEIININWKHIDQVSVRTVNVSDHSITKMEFMLS